MTRPSLRSVQRLDLSILSGRHNWKLEPEKSMIFRRYVLESNAPRADMKRYRKISEKCIENAKTCFTRLSQTGTQFLIPSTIRCDRTFVRDAEEAYYIDAMSDFLNSPDPPSVQDMPFVKRPLHHRLHCAFNRRSGYFKELEERRRRCLWLAFDEFENMYLNDDELVLYYPRVEYYISRYIQPPALPVPVPFVAYYYNEELVEAQAALDAGNELSERQNKLLFCLEHEYSVFFVAMWIMEACYGRRQYVLLHGTINLLERNVADLRTIAGHEVMRIFEFMRLAADLPVTTHNWTCFRHQIMEDSAFVWAIAETGEFDDSTPSEQCLWISMGKGRIRMQSSALLPRSAVLDRVLLPADLEKIQGLRELVHDNQWHRDGPLTVGNALQRLMDTVRSNSVSQVHPRGMEQYWAINRRGAKVVRSPQVEQHVANTRNCNRVPGRQDQCNQFSPRSPEYSPVHEIEQQRFMERSDRKFYIDRSDNRNENIPEKQQGQNDMLSGMNHLPTAEQSLSTGMEPVTFLSRNSCFARIPHVPSTPNMDKNVGRSKDSSPSMEEEPWRVMTRSQKRKAEESAEQRKKDKEAKKLNSRVASDTSQRVDLPSAGTAGKESSAMRNLVGSHQKTRGDEARRRWWYTIKYPERN